MVSALRGAIYATAVAGLLGASCGAYLGKIDNNFIANTTKQRSIRNFSARGLLDSAECVRGNSVRFTADDGSKVGMPSGKIITDGITTTKVSVGPVLPSQRRRVAFTETVQVGFETASGAESVELAPCK